MFMYLAKSSMERKNKYFASVVLISDKGIDVNV